MNDDPSQQPRTLADLLARQPSANERQRRADDLLERAHHVRARGWHDYRYTWSTGEVAGVALLIEDAAVLNDVAEDETAALDTWAATLWGIARGEADSNNNHEQTRAWFSTLRVNLDHDWHPRDPNGDIVR